LIEVLTRLACSKGNHLGTCKQVKIGGKAGEGKGDFWANPLGDADMGVSEIVSPSGGIL
jgi:hypothetical protein